MRLLGVFAPIPTAFDDAEALDVVRLRLAAQQWAKTPLTGLLVLGTTGEFALLDDDESDRAVEAVRAALPDDRVLIAGVTRESTRATIRAAKRAAALGADAVIARTPMFHRSRMDGAALLRHYSALADASPAPVLLYNFAAATGVDLRPETVARLAEHPNIAGMKESGSAPERISELVASTPRAFSVLSGSGSTFHAALRAGASGGILAVACLLPDVCARLFDLARAGQHDQASALQERLVPIARWISGDLGLPGLKAALGLRGFEVGPPRSPLAALVGPAVQSLIEMVAALEAVPA